MPKLAIKYSGKDINFLLHDLPEHLSRSEADHLSINDQYLAKKNED